MKVEVVKMIPDEASTWLSELFEFVVGELSADFEKIELMIVESFQQAKTRMQEQGRPSTEIGLTGIMRGADGVQEYSPWKSAVNLISNGFTLESLLRTHHIRVPIHLKLVELMSLGIIFGTVTS